MGSLARPLLQRRPSMCRYLASNPASIRPKHCNELTLDPFKCFRNRLGSTAGVCRSTLSRKGQRHAKISQKVLRQGRLRALQTSEVHTEESHKKAEVQEDDKGIGGDKYGISVSDLQRFSELAPHEVFAPKTGFFVSAAHLAKLLQSSLTSGVSGGPTELAARRQALGSNSLPERDQVCLINGTCFFLDMHSELPHCIAADTVTRAWYHCTCRLLNSFCLRPGRTSGCRQGLLASCAGTLAEI